MLAPVRQRSRRFRMPPILAIAGVVAVLLAVYLVVAMLAPEIFG